MTQEARLSSFIANRAREVASLQADDQTKNARSRDNIAQSLFSGGGDSIDRVEPPKDEYRRYWRQFETTPIIREPITSFAREIVEPGYRVESPDLDEEELRQLVNWLRRVAVMEGETDKNITAFIKKAIVQREVKGTVFIEKVHAEEDEEAIAGLKFIPPETMEINKRPNQNIILIPGDESEFEDVPVTEDGDAAGYTQTRPGQSRFTGSGGGSSDNEINFSKHDIIKLTRDADVGEALGTSRLESVSQRIEGLKNKLRDNDEAIASKAYPLWLFLFGSQEAPWDRDDIDGFMQQHEVENFHPGMKQGVRGDVSVETISGEVADLANALEFDLNYILTAMPKAKYTLGAFEASINQFVTQSQERDTMRQIKEARREVEAELSPVVQQKAMELFGVDEEAAQNIRLRLGSPREEEMPNQQNVNVIRYIGGDVRNETPQNDQSPQGGPQGNPQGQPNDQPQDTGEDDDTNVASEQGKALWEAELTETELADPRSVSTTEEQGDVSDVVNNTLMNFRQEVLSELEKFENTPETALFNFDNMANARVNSVINDSQLTQKLDPVMQSVIRDTLNTLGQNNQEVELDVPFTFRHEQQASSFVSNVEQATRNALHEFVRRMRVQLERGVNVGENVDTIVARMRNDFSAAELRQRANIIAHMETLRAVETTKLNEFTMSEEVVAVRPINSGGASTPICADLTGQTGDQPAIAKVDGDLSQQWQEQVPEQLTHNGFDPVPATPPFHFGCKTQLVPVTEEQLNEYEPRSGEVYTVEQLEEKYGIEVQT